jgi:hypothetical protein
MRTPPTKLNAEKTHAKAPIILPPPPPIVASTKAKSLQPMDVNCGNVLRNRRSSVDDDGWGVEGTEQTNLDNALHQYIDAYVTFAMLPQSPAR